MATDETTDDMQPEMKQILLLLFDDDDGRRTTTEIKDEMKIKPQEIRYFIGRLRQKELVTSYSDGAFDEVEYCALTDAGCAYVMEKMRGKLKK